MGKDDLSDEKIGANLDSSTPDKDGIKVSGDQITFEIEDLDGPGRTIELHLRDAWLVAGCSGCSGKGPSSVANTSTSATGGATGSGCGSS